MLRTSLDRLAMGTPSRWLMKLTLSVLRALRSTQAEPHTSPRVKDQSVGFSKAANRQSNSRWHKPAVQTNGVKGAQIQIRFISSDPE